MSQSSQLDPTERRLVLLLRDERLRQQISATALAASIKVSRTTITHIENDESRPTLWVLLKIAEGLGINLAEYLEQALEMGKKLK
ncbi:MAG: helix-turn-helix domain-containing protein [Prosthecobacter sp.]